MSNAKHFWKINNYLRGVLLLSVVVFLTGCATRAYVREYVGEKLAPFDERAGRLEGRASELEKGALATRDKIEGIEKRTLQIEGDVKETAVVAKGAAVDAKAAKERAEAVLKRVEGLKIMKEVVLKSSDVRFNFDKWELTKEQEEVLGKLALELKDKPYSIIVIAGHTDNVGSEKYNLNLGRSRAEATASYLATKSGIDSSRMIVLTFGESVPVASNNTKEGREQNRRVEITVYTDTLE